MTQTSTKTSAQSSNIDSIAFSKNAAVSEKNSKEQGSLLYAMSSSANNIQSICTKSTSPKSVMNAKAEALYQCALLQDLEARLEQKQQELGREISLAQLELANNNVEKIQEKIKEIAEAQERQRQAETARKVLGWLSIALGALVSLVNPAIGVQLLLTGITMLASPIIAKATSGVSTLLQKAGLPKKVANVVAAVVVTVVIAAVTYGLGSAAGLASGASSAAATSTGRLGTLLAALKNNPRLILATVSGLSAAQASNLTTFVVEALVTDKAKQQKYEAIANVVEMVLLVLASCGLCTASATETAGLSLFEKFEKALGPEGLSILQKAEKVLTSHSFQSFLVKSMIATVLFNEAATLATVYTNYKQADIKGEMAPLQGTKTRLETNLQYMNTFLQTLQSDMTQHADNIKLTATDMRGFSEGLNAYANAAQNF